jgi:formylmethanofuran dehydrogenase subunit E
MVVCHELITAGHMTAGVAIGARAAALAATRTGNDA